MRFSEKMAWSAVVLLAAYTLASASLFLALWRYAGEQEEKAEVGELYKDAYQNQVKLTEAYKDLLSARGGGRSWNDRVQ